MSQFLSFAQIQQIKRLYFTNRFSVQSIARKIGVSIDDVIRIVLPQDEIVITADGFVLDGQHRMQALCQNNG